jgi:endonuclease YncB( thermonuclease family)
MKKRKVKPKKQFIVLFIFIYFYLYCKMTTLTVNDVDFSKHGLNTPFLSLDGIVTKARVVSVYDGDTLTLVVPFKGDFYKVNCRMLGIDTCEMKAKTQINKNIAVRARNRVLQLLGVPITDLDVILPKNKIQSLLSDNVYTCWVHCHETEKFGRTLVDVRTSADALSPSIAQILLNEKLAYEYKGDTKLTEEQQLQIMT